MQDISKGKLSQYVECKCKKMSVKKLKPRPIYAFGNRLNGVDARHTEIRGIWRSIAGALYPAHHLWKACSHIVVVSSLIFGFLGSSAGQAARKLSSCCYRRRGRAGDQIVEDFL